MKWKLLFLAFSMCLFTLVVCAAETNATKKIGVVYGDSITKGEQLNNHNEGWASLVEAQSKGALVVVNEGKGGRPTISLQEFEAMMKRQPKMDLLVIALGGNDARDVSGNCVPNAVVNLKAMIGRARETYGAKLPILLVGPTNINKDALGPTKSIGPQREANLVALNAAYAELAKTENCGFVSTFGAVRAGSLKNDGVHPDADGHAEIARVMLPAIAQAAGVSLPQFAPAQDTSNQSTGTAPTGLEIRLWDGPAPGTPEDTGSEVMGPDGRTRNVSIPTLTAYLPDKKLANGTAIIMCSGGAYTQLALKKYADLGTEAFPPRGIAVFNLKYRLTPPSKNVRADALADVKRAVRLVRSRAAEWNINPNHIGLIGASAGANLILNLMSTADTGQPYASDAIERQSSRPNFAVLLSAWPGGQKITDFHFTKDVPVFLLHATDDATAPVEFAREIEVAAKNVGATIHAEYFPTGGHDAFGSLSGRYSDWPQRFLLWLEAQKMLGSSS